MVVFQQMNPRKKEKYENSSPLPFSNKTKQNKNKKKQNKKHTHKKKKTDWLEISVQNCLKFSSTFGTVLSDALLHCSLEKPEHKHAVGMSQNRTYH